MPEDTKTCFIIMPITTPETHLKVYRDGKEHFKHVLHHLHIPAVKKAGFTPIPPVAEGSDLIQARIIQNLENADLVLCDISTLNPNVFFELGVRTSLNRPVCYVMDEHTKKIPFDTSVLNHKEYKSSLDPWDLDKDVPIISDHIKTSFEGSKSVNSLWRHFSIKSQARPYERKMGTEGQYEEILFQLDSIRETIKRSGEQDDKFISPAAPHAMKVIGDDIDSVLPNTIQLSALEPINSDTLRVFLIGSPEPDTEDEIMRTLDQYNLKCVLVYQIE